MSMNFIPTDFIKSQSILKNSLKIRNSSYADCIGPGTDSTVKGTMPPKNAAVKKWTKLLFKLLSLKGEVLSTEQSTSGPLRLHPQTTLCTSCSAPRLAKCT